MIAPARSSNRRLTIAGTTTLPTATPAPARIVPAKSAAADGAARTRTPTRTGTSASASARSAPRRRVTAGAIGASSPKQRIGTLVTSPAAADEKPRSAAISSITGGTLATGMRRFSPARTIPAASSTASPLDPLEPDVVLRQRGRRRRRRGDVRELRELQLHVERVAALEPVQHRGHPPREVLRAPDAAQDLRRVPRERRVVAAFVPGGERVGQDADVGHREVEPLRAGRRHDVSGVAGEEQAAELHRFDDEAPHSRHALLDDRAAIERPARELEPALELVPDPLVRPLVDLFVGPALEVQPGQRGRAHAVQREPTLVVRVDQLVVRRRRLGEDPEPAERVLARELGQHPGRDRPAAGPVVAVAAGDEVTCELAPFPFVDEGDRRRFCIDPGERHVLGLEEQRPPALDPRGYQVLDDLLLPVNRDRAAACERRKVDPVALAGELQLDSLVDEALAAQAIADAHLLEQVDGALLEHAGPDPALDVLAAARFQDDRIDSAEVEELRQHEAGGAGAHDPDLRPHQPSCSFTTSWKTAKAPFASGTPQ